MQRLRGPDYIVIGPHVGPRASVCSLVIYIQKYGIYTKLSSITCSYNLMAGKKATLQQASSRLPCLPRHSG